MRKKEIIKYILIENQARELPHVIKRDLSLPLNSKKIISVIGSRRAGKTYLLFDTINKLLNRGVPEEKILFINFEDERLDLKSDELDLIIQSFIELYPETKLCECYFFFDEVQNIEGWEIFIRRCYDSITKNIFITGSNSKLLSTEIATSLRGRTIKYEVFPLNFREFINFKSHYLNDNDNLVKINQLLSEKIGNNKVLYSIKYLSVLKIYFEEYMYYGGFPEIVFLDERLKLKTLQEYFDVMLYRDLVERYCISNSLILKYFLRRVLENITNKLSINKIFNELKSQNLKIGKNSLYNYIEYAKNAYIIDYLREYSKSELRREFSDKKVYFVDNGLVTANRMINKENYGVLLENLFYHELNTNELFRGNIFFYKSKKECDFIIDYRKSIIPVQVSYNIDNEAVLNREISGLTEACIRYKAEKGYIVTMDDERTIIKNDLRIEIIPVYKLLINLSAYF